MQPSGIYADGELLEREIEKILRTLLEDRNPHLRPRLVARLQRMQALYRELNHLKERSNSVH